MTAAFTRTHPVFLWDGIAYGQASSRVVPIFISCGHEGVSVTTHGSELVLVGKSEVTQSSVVGNSISQICAVVAREGWRLEEA